MAGNFQVMKNHYLGKNSFMYFNDFRDLYFFYTNIFSQMPVYLVGYAKRMLFGDTKHNAFDQF